MGMPRIIFDRFEGWLDLSLLWLFYTRYQALEEGYLPTCTCSPLQAPQYALATSGDVLILQLQQPEIVAFRLLN